MTATAFSFYRIPYANNSKVAYCLRHVSGYRATIFHAETAPFMVAIDTPEGKTINRIYTDTLKDAYKAAHKLLRQYRLAHAMPAITRADEILATRPVAFFDEDSRHALDNVRRLRDHFQAMQIEHKAGYKAALDSDNWDDFRWHSRAESVMICNRYSVLHAELGHRSLTSNR